MQWGKWERTTGFEDWGVTQNWGESGVRCWWGWKPYCKGLGQWWEVQSNKEDRKENGSFGSSNKQILRLSKPGNVSEKGGVKIPEKRIYQNPLDKSWSLSKKDICLSKVSEKVGKDGISHSSFFSKKEKEWQGGEGWRNISSKYWCGYRYMLRWIGYNIKWLGVDLFKFSLENESWGPPETEENRSRAWRD